jgi:hypothetical protein
MRKKVSRTVNLNKLKEKAQTVFNTWIRQRDSKDGYFTCISCFRTLPVDQMNAGHYVPVKGGSFLRYDEHNVNGECIRCNGFDEFHLIGYRKHLIMKIGQRNVNRLENTRHTVYKWSEDELNDIIKKYKTDGKSDAANYDIPF